jgi:hypothetical protein
MLATPGLPVHGRQDQQLLKPQPPHQLVLSCFHQLPPLLLLPLVMMMMMRMMLMMLVVVQLLLRLLLLQVQLLLPLQDEHMSLRAAAGHVAPHV